MKIKFRKLSSSAVAPRQGSSFSAGFDLTATSMSYESSTGTLCYGTGLAFEIPVGHVGLLFPRSSVYRMGQFLTNCVGVLDSDYRGEVMFRFAYRKDCSNVYQIGDRIGQLIVMPIPAVDYVESDNLSTTVRGTGGYGSTGR